MSDEVAIGKKKFNISDLAGLTKSEVEKLGDKSLIDIFMAINANGDEKLDTSEVSIFAKNIRKADYNGDGIITEKELKKYVKENAEAFDGDIQNKTKVKGKNVLNFIELLTGKKRTENPQESASDYEVFAQTDDEVKDSTINMLDDEVNRGYELIFGQDDGFISKTYNDIKERLHSDMAKSTLMKNLYIKNEYNELLKRAKEGTLTRNEFYGKMKQNLFDTFPGINELSGEEKEKLVEYINGLEPKQIQRLQDRILQMPNPDDPGYEQSLSDFNISFSDEAFVKTTANNSDGINTVLKDKRAKDPYVLTGGDQLITFEEVYKDTQGVEYKRENIEKFNQDAANFSLYGSVVQKQTRIHEILDSSINLVEGNNRYGVSAEINAASDKRLENSIVLALKELCGDDEKAMNEAFQKMTGRTDLQIVNGSLKCLTGGGYAPLKINGIELAGIAKQIVQTVDSRVLDVTKGKSIKDLSRELEESYKKTFGSKNLAQMAQAYVNDQKGAVQTVRSGIEYAGVGAMAVGMFCCPPLAVAGGAVSGFGGVGVEMLDEATKKNVSKERMDELKKELATNGTLMIAGMGAGMMGSAAKAVALANNCPKLTAMAAEIGVDATISLVSDMALTGQIDLKGEGLAQVMSLLAGLKTSKIGIKNAAAKPDVLGISFQPKRNSLLDKVFGSADINPTDWRNKYKAKQKEYCYQNHREFHATHPELFAGNEEWNCWSECSVMDKHHGPWKMHLYSVSEEDWQRMADVIIPYLKERGVEWKTLGSQYDASHLNGSDQQGKAFTIYPRDNADFEQIARDLDYIIKNNNLETSGSHITGDNNLGSTGRLFYRYEFKTGRMKNEVLDLSNQQDKDIYNQLYDPNRGEGNYLARDMSASDDPWLRFDPADRNSKPSYADASSQGNFFGDRQIHRITNYGRLQYGEIYDLGNIRQVRIANINIDINDPVIMNQLRNMPDGTYIKIGRGEDCHVRIRGEYNKISRDHLIIYKYNGRLFIQDVSSNGSYIDRS